jgi:hypothetical protein
MNTSKRTLTLLPEQYAICKLPPGTPVPAWALHHQASFCSVTRSPDELSIICPQEQAPVEIGANTGWRCLKLNGPIGLDEPGVLASMVTPLGEAGVSVFAVATYDTDYLLVQKLDAAIAALEKAACRVILP